MDAKIAIACAALAALVAGAACIALLGGGEDGGPDAPPEAGFVVDAAGRSVPVPESIERIVTVGSAGPLRTISLFDRGDFHPVAKIVGCDIYDATENRSARAYLHAFDMTRIPERDRHSGLDSASAERIAALDPSLVVMSHAEYQGAKEAAEVLAKKCPVLVIPDQNPTRFFDPETLELESWYVDGVEMVGRALGQEARAAEHLSEVSWLLHDVRSCVGTGGGSCYVVGVTYRGNHEWNTTFPVYIPLQLARGVNSYSGGGTAPSVTLDVEEVNGRYIPGADVVLIDPASSNMLGGVDSQLVMAKIWELNNDSDPGNDVRLHAVVPTMSLGLNCDCAIACSYYLCHVLYGTLTLEEAEGRASHVFELFYGDAGRSVLGDMSAFFERKAAESGASLPMMREVAVVREGGTYTARPAPGAGPVQL